MIINPDLNPEDLDDMLHDDYTDIEYCETLIKLLDYEEDSAIVCRMWPEAERLMKLCRVTNKRREELIKRKNNE